MLSDKKNMEWLRRNFLFLLVFIHPMLLLANPFTKFEKDLDLWKAASGTSDDKNILAFFRQGNFTPSEDSEYVDPADDLPKYLKFSTIISTKIIEEKGIVIKKHTVKKNDTLSSLAKIYKTSIQQIKSQNGLKTDTIRLGDVLEVPVVTENASRKKIVTRRMFISPVPNSRVTSHFGRRTDPFNKYNKIFHSGIDLGAPIGTPVVAAADGEVVFTGKNGGYGNTVMILHASGYKTVYAHCSKILVEVGEKVKMGRVIAAVGRTGTATGAHLHFEVHKNGKIINPQSALSMYEKIVTNLSQKSPKETL